MEETRQLLICPGSSGINTQSVESLSSYVQRLASVNCLSIPSAIEVLAKSGHLPLTRQINSRFLRTIDLQLALVPSPLFAMGAPWELLDRLSLVAIFRAFYGTLFSHPVAIHTFFAAPHGKRSFEINRRWCPSCLLQQPSYQSLWQFSDVTTCLVHRCALRERCTSCQHPISLLHMNSFFDRCERCYARLSTQPSLPAPQHLLGSQKDLQVDYASLLSGQLALSGDVRSCDWRRSLIYVREQKELTREQLAKALHVSPSTIILLESDSEIVSLHVIIRAARYLAGSLVSLSRTSVPPEWLPRLARKCRPLAQRNGLPSNLQEQTVLKQIVAALRKLERKRCNLTISRLSAASGIKQRTLEQVLAATPSLRHRFKVSKEAMLRSTLRHKFQLLLLKVREANTNVEGATLESLCRSMGTSKNRLKEVDERLYGALRTALQNARAALNAQREQSLIHRLKALMEHRATCGLTCSRRVIAKQLRCEFKNYPDVYATWRKLRRL